MTRTRRAAIAGLALLAFGLVLAVFAGATWCDEGRFGYFLQASPAPYEVPAVDFTLEHAGRYPDAQSALDAVGSTVRAEDPDSARDFFAWLEAENAVAVHVEQGNYFVAGYEQTPSDAWRAVCT